MTDPTVIIITGPTAVGKTAAAVHLAQQLSTSIISADSRQCFKELNIGVAKPSPEELQAVHHYFINSHSIREEVTAALFEELALAWTQEIFHQQTAANKPPVAVMVGGTGLYIKAYAEGLDTIPPIDPGIRQQIQQMYETAGIGWLQAQIQDSDPAFFRVGEIQNPQRLMRALEVKRSTGQSILAFRTREKKPRPFKIEKIGLSLPKEVLHDRIHRRVDTMMAEGLLDEVRGLLPYRELNALQTVGYTELFDHLEGKLSLDEAVQQIKVNTRRYAKRQLTWFRKDPSIRWVDAGEAMRKTLLICLLFVSTVCFGQGIIPYNSNNNTDGNTSTASFPVTIMHGVPFPQEKYVRLTLGTPFFSENWMQGKILLQNGAISGDISLRLNLLENTINYLNPQGQEMVVTEPARYIIMKDSAGVEYSFLHGDQLTGDPALQSTWFQVLVNSRISLCKQSKKAVRESKGYGSATIEQSIQTSDIFYIKSKEAFIRIKNWDHLLTVLDDKKELVRQYSKARHLNGREQSDYVQLLTYYNSLL